MQEPKIENEAEDHSAHPIIAVASRRCDKVSDPEPIDRQNCYVLQTYIDAIAAAGGIPIIIPVVKNLDLSRISFDGVLVPGGGDVHPTLYGGYGDDCTSVDREVDNLDTQLINYAMLTERPILGICRGLEILNVVLGGTLNPRVDEKERYHDRHDLKRTALVHNLLAAENSWLAKLLNGKEFLPSNSLHHQGCENVTPSLNLVGVANDDRHKVPEVLESPKRMKLDHPIDHIDDFPLVFAVQSHPEELYESVYEWKLAFQAFIEASRTRMIRTR